MNANTRPDAILNAGDIQTARLHLRLADGANLAPEIPVLILDVRSGPARKRDDAHTRVLWQRVDSHMQPTGEPHWSAIDNTGAAMPYDSPPALQLDLRHSQHLGRYQPRDTDDNSLEILRDAAIARVHQLAGAPAGVAEALTVYRATEDQRDVALRHLHEQIRQAVARGDNVADIAAITAYSKQRIYQIRDERR